MKGKLMNKAVLKVIVGANMLVALMAGGIMLAQDTKVAPAGKEAIPAALPAEAKLTDVQRQQLRAIAAEFARLELKYNIVEFTKDRDPLVAERDAVIISACRSMGMSDPEIQQECRFNIDVKDANGKSQGPRIWRERPQAAAASAPAGK
jgi:hypothetical protein